MRTLIQLLFSLFTIAAIIWVAWQGYLLIDSRGQQLEPAQRSLLVGVSLIALICTFMITSSVRTAALERSRSPLYSRKAELYEAFVGIWQNLKNQMQSEEDAQFLLKADELKSSITLYGNAEVIKQINELLQKAEEQGPHKAQPEFESLMIAMRADLGFSNLYPLRAEVQKLFSSSTNS